MKKGRTRSRSKSKNSCNGCRVLRKGCSDNCVLRSCMAWIDSAEAQSRATLFLSKFFGRAGLLRLISSSPPHLRPHAFVSLLYEACGRSVSPVYGCTGLYLSGNSHVCEFAVNAVVKGLGSSLMLSRENSSKPVSVSVSTVCRDNQNLGSECAHEEGSNHEENEGAELDLSLGMTCNISKRTTSTRNNPCS